MQMSYDWEAPAGVLGLPTEDFTKYIDTAIPQVAVKTGQLLVADKTPGKVRNAAKLPTAAAEITGPGAMGFVILDATRFNGDKDWPVKRPTPVMRHGRIWLLAETAVARWTYPFIRFAGTGTNGAIRNDADGANAVECQRVILLTDAEAGGLVLAEVQFY